MFKSSICFKNIYKFLIINSFIYFYDTINALINKYREKSKGENLLYVYARKTLKCSLTKKVLRMMFVKNYSSTH